MGDFVVLEDGSEVQLVKEIKGVGFQARHTMCGKKEQIRREWISAKAKPRPEGLWEDLAERMIQDNDPGRAPAALIAAVKVDRKVQYLPSYGAINAIPYLFQYTPLFALRRSPWGRILVADETGLGKTVEAGIILEELFRSQDPAESIGDALIIGPKSLQAEWDEKLATHFERSIRQLSTQDLIDRLTRGGEPEKGEFLYYLSMDALPGLLKKDRLEEKDIRLNNLFDMVIVDEAHHFKNPESKRRKALARILGDKAIKESVDTGGKLKLPKLLLLTATPLSTSLENLFSYFTLMDPTLSSVYGLERQQMAFQSEHRRVVLARRLANLVFRLLNEPDNIDVQDRLKTFLEKVENRDLLLEVEADEEASAAYEVLYRFALNPNGTQSEVLADALLHLDPWCDMVVRNTRRGVELQGNTRVVVENLCVQLFPEEIRKANKVPFWNMEPLAQVSYRQMLASSIHGLVHREAIHSLAKTSPDDSEREALVAQDEEETEEGATEVFWDEDGDFQSQPLSYQEMLSLRDAKWESLLKALKSFFDDKNQRGGLLFTRFTATASYLWMRIKNEAKSGGLFPGLRIEYIHGKIPADRRAELIRDLREAGFDEQKSDASSRQKSTYEDSVLLILTEVGQEGIDLQFCTGVFHYDLPWNPMRLVQRNGRVHRIGQRAPEVFIHTFFVDGSLDLRISQAIALRMKMVYDTFGDLPDGLFGGEAGDSLKDCGVEGHLLLQDLLKGKKHINLEEELEHRVSKIEHETEQIQLHKEQIQKLLSDESEACQAWKPLVQEALHGSFGSLERVLRSDVEALLTWSTESGKNVNAQPLDEATGLWDLRWNTPFGDDRTGAMGRAARRELAKRNQMVAQILPDDGRSRASGLASYQVLHLAHPIVANISTQTLKDFQRPILLAASGAVDRPCALVCLEFEIRDPQHIRCENRWFLLEPPETGELNSSWNRLPQRGSAEKMKAILGDLDWWTSFEPTQAEEALKGLREGLDHLHNSIREEEIERRGRLEIKRRVRHLRHLKRVLEYWSSEQREKQSLVSMYERLIDRMEIGEISDIGLDRHRRRLLPDAKGALTKATKELDRLKVLQEQLQEEVQRFRTVGPEGIRVSVFDLKPDALLMIQPRGQA